MPRTGSLSRAVVAGMMGGCAVAPWRVEPAVALDPSELPTLANQSMNHYL
jgi:hypothetical protein